MPRLIYWLGVICFLHVLSCMEPLQKTSDLARPVNERVNKGFALDMNDLEFYTDTISIFISNWVTSVAPT